MKCMKWMLIVGACLSSNAQSKTVLLWDSVPLRMAIPSDSETVLRLPMACEVGVPSSVTGQLGVDSVERVVLLKPSSPFKSERIALRAIGTNQVYLIDVTASTTARADDYELVDPRIAPAAAAPSSDVFGEADTTDVRIALTRFAAREFYAPNRLRGGIRAVRVPVESAAFSLYRGHSVQAIPRAAWSYRGHWVTAVELTNTTADHRTLDPRLLRGAWLTATFQHGVLAPAGQPGDMTMVYLVSGAQFEAVR